MNLLRSMIRSIIKYLQHNCHIFFSLLCAFISALPLRGIFFLFCRALTTYDNMNCYIKSCLFVTTIERETHKRQTICQNELLVLREKNYNNVICYICAGVWYINLFIREGYSCSLLLIIACQKERKNVSSLVHNKREARFETHTANLFTFIQRPRMCQRLNWTIFLEKKLFFLLFILLKELLHLYFISIFIHLVGFQSPFINFFILSLYSTACCLMIVGIVRGCGVD